MAEPPAIRITGLGRYSGPPIEFDGAARPREAWRTLLRFAGINLRDLTDQNTHRTAVIGGHVLRDVTLEIARGSVVCLAGPTGSGKNVLLQILAGVTAPTSGRAEIFGTVSSLLAGKGELDLRTTALDNIQASPQYQRASPDEGERFTADVLDFAELHGFETAPLKTFSTGMQLRLGVALVLCSLSDILLLDDVMAVGDIAFQQKCVARVRTLAREGRTIVAAFSDEAVVQQIATRVVTIVGGRVAGDTLPGARTREDTGGSEADVAWHVSSELPEDDATALRALAVAPGRESGASCIDLAMSFEAKADQVICRPSVTVNKEGFGIFRTLAPEFLTLQRGRRARWTVRIPTGMLSDGPYSLMVNMQSQTGDAVYALKAHDAVTLDVRRPDAAASAAEARGRGAPLLLATQFPWELETVEQESLAS
jgi:ABC-type polysaccharide/polyol phosphate transport system ATPase subunit